MHNNTVCKINLTVFGLSCVQKSLKNNRLLCRWLLLYLTCCNRFSLNWKTSESRAALHLRSLSTFLWISLQTYFFFFSPPHVCICLLTVMVWQVLATNTFPLFFVLSSQTEMNVLPFICLIHVHYCHNSMVTYSSRLPFPFFFLSLYPCCTAVTVKVSYFSCKGYTALFWDYFNLYREQGSPTERWWVVVTVWVNVWSCKVKGWPRCLLTTLLLKRAKDREMGSVPLPFP